MKTTFFFLLTITFSVIMISCQKQSPVPVSPTASETTSASDVLPTDATYMYQGKAVTRASEIACYNSPDRVVLATDKITGKPTYFFFDNADEGETFINQYPVMRDLQIKVRQCREMRNYALEHDEYTRLEKTGSFSEDYINFTKQYASHDRGLALLYTNINYGGAVFQLNSAFPVPLLPAWMNNNGESAQAPFGAVIANTLWDGPGYGAPGLWLNFNHPNFWAVNFVNRASSAN